MSIYNPPSKTQGVFNPSNFGGLGAGGQITTEYLDANYLSFPVAQGNTTLVGTSVLGDITQQGDFTTTGDINASSFLVGTTNLLTEIGTKQNTIQDGDLTIAKTSGLQTALDNKYDDTGGTISGSVTITSDLVVGTTNIITEIGTKQNTIQDGDLTIAKTSGLQTALDNKYDDTGGTISGSVNITGDLVVGTTNIITDLGTKQNTIQDGDLTIAKTSGLQTALDNKYNDTGGTINGSVNITGDLVVGTTNVITEIGTKQDTIGDGDLTIAKTNGLQTALDAKQATITTATDLTSKSLTTNVLVVNESLNIDNVNTYEKYKQFDTLVMRRQDEDDTRVLNPNEIQVFVNNDNILFPNPTGMTSYFAKWSAKSTPINSVSGAGTELVYNNTIEFGAESLSAGGANALIIKNITPTFVDEIQAIVFYHRGNGGLASLTTGLIFELYNSVDDTDLLVPLAVTPIITTSNYLHRFDFPAITTYTNGFFDNAYQSTTQIPDITKSGLPSYAITTLNIIDAEVSIAGNVDISGVLTCDTITLPIIGDVETAIQGKQPTITTSTDLTPNTITTTGNGNIGGNLTITGKLTNTNQPAFRAVSGVSSQVPAGTPIKYNTEIIDNENAHLTTTGEYTIRKAGNWFFYYSFQSNGVAFNVQLQQNGVVRDQVSTDTTPTINTDLGCKGMTIIPCVVDDVIRVFVVSGSVRVENAGQFHSFGGFLIG